MLRGRMQSGHMLRGHMLIGHMMREHMLRGHMLREHMLRGHMLRGHMWLIGSVNMFAIGFCTFQIGFGKRLGLSGSGSVL